MEFRQLRNFVRIVELGSITAAAGDLNVAQPALSRQVRALEEELDVALLRRHGRGVMATEEGLLLARRSRVILDEMNDMIGAVSGHRRSLSGLLTLGLPPTVADVLATHMVRRTLAVYPDVTLRIVSGFSGHVRDWLLRGKIDLGVAYEDQKSPMVKARPIILEKLFLVQSPAIAGAAHGTPIDAEEVLRLPLVLPNPEHGLRVRLDAVARAARIPLDVVLEIDILPSMLAIVAGGAGSTILPLVSVIDKVREGALIARPIVRRTIDRTLVLTSPLDRPGSRLATEFSDFLIAEVHELSNAGKWPGTTL